MATIQSVAEVATIHSMAELATIQIGGGVKPHDKQAELATTR